MSIKNWTLCALSEILVASTWLWVNFLWGKMLSSKSPWLFFFFFALQIILSHFANLKQPKQLTCCACVQCLEITLNKKYLSGMKCTTMIPTTRAERAQLFSFYTLHLLKGNLEIKVEARSHERHLTLILPHLESDRTLKIIRKSLVSSLNRKYIHTVCRAEGTFLLLALEVLWS